MVLLVTSSPRVGECAAAIAKATGEEVQVAADLHAADTAFRTRDYAAVVLDESLYQMSPGMADAALRRAGDAVPLVMNFGISGAERVMVEVRGALRRANRELLQARAAAARELRSELMDAVTGILLSTELVLREEGLPAPAQERMRSVEQLACRMRATLEKAH